MASYLVPMCNIYKFNLFNPDIALFAVQKVGLSGGRFCHESMEEVDMDGSESGQELTGNETDESE
jgi:hypothetical protein